MNQLERNRIAAHKVSDGAPPTNGTISSKQADLLMGRGLGALDFWYQTQHYETGVRALASESRDGVMRTWLIRD